MRREAKVGSLPLVRAVLCALSLSLGGAAAARAAEEQGAEKQPETRRVVYLPESVKQEVIEQIRKEVMEQAKAEGWAWSNLVPVWLQRVRFFGDVRARFERVLYPQGNANGGEFPDFNAINNGKPFDVNFVDYANERYLDVDQNRTRPRIRARLGLETDVGSGFLVRLRVGSGDSSTPVSTNQTLGTPGDFSKTPLWLDRATVVFDAFYRENATSQAENLIERRHLMLEAGRMENPFFTTEMLFDKNVNFDGLALHGDLLLVEPFARLFFTAGAFPLKITSLAFPAERPAKFPSRNQWLYAAQVGLESHVDIFKFKLGFGFFDFDKVEGRTSGPCDTNLASVSCDSDDTRPGYAQFGNTYLALRTPSAAALALESSGTVPRYQYFGLASRFRELTASLRTEVKVDTDVRLTVEGEYAHNAGFNAGQVAGVALNNRGPVEAGQLFGPFQGGADGAIGRLTLGSPTQNRPWDWRVGVSYRYVQSDATLDALVDGDFALGGTNFKGYSLEAALSVALDLTVSARWFSADAIAGPRYSIDVLQLDLQSRF